MPHQSQAPAPSQERSPDVVLNLDHQLLAASLIECLQLLDPLLHLHSAPEIQAPAAQVVVRLRYLAQCLPEFSTSSQLQRSALQFGREAQHILVALRSRALLNRG